MPSLKMALSERIPKWRDEIRQIIKDHGDKVISQVTVSQIYGGLRGVNCVVCDTSSVDPDHGLQVRGHPISALTERLPEEMFYLLCTGELPDAKALKELQNELRARSEVPAYVWSLLRELPGDMHPMRMFDTAILSMGRDSEFRHAYSEGMQKEEYWETVLEDALRLIAKLPAIAAGVYRLRFSKGNPISSARGLDWAGNYARMLGIEDRGGEFANLLRLYLTLSCDHEAGSASSVTCHVAGSSLADPYYAVSAGMHGLAGPLHGRSSADAIEFVRGIQQECGGVPSEDQVRKYTWRVLESGQVVPGYGHAVLRMVDPRFTALQAFGKRACGGDPLFRIVELCAKVVPEVLREQGKARNPFPNIDACGGVLLNHFGLTEASYYMVVFGVSRALGMLAQLILNRGIGTPISRPKSVSTAWIKSTVASG